MSIFQKPKVQTLSEWLEIATKKLAEPSKERIRAEIEAHYAEAIETHCDNGLSEGEAQTAALAELGNPKAARKRFRKQHLTEWEAEWLKKFSDRARKPYGLLGCYAAFCLFTLVPPSWQIIDDFPHPSLFITLAFIVLVLSPSFCFIVARRKAAKANRFLLSVDCTTHFLSLVWIYQIQQAMFPRQASTRWFFFALWVLIYFRHIWIPLRIWMKLGKVGTSLSRSSGF
jgi:hypothetical protein